MSKRRKMGSFPRQSFPKPDQVKNSHMLQNVGRRRGFCLLAPGFTPWKKGISIPGSTKTTLLREELSDPFFYENSIWTIANVFTLCKWAKNFMVKRDAPKGCPSRSSSSSLSGTLPSRRSQCYSPSLSILCAVSWDLWRITIYIYMICLWLCLQTPLTIWQVVFCCFGFKETNCESGVFFFWSSQSSDSPCNEFCHSEAPWNVVRLPEDGPGVFH